MSLASCRLASACNFAAEAALACSAANSSVDLVTFLVSAAKRFALSSLVSKFLRNWSRLPVVEIE